MGAPRTLRFDSRSRIAAGRRAARGGDLASARSIFEGVLAAGDAPASDRVACRNELAGVLLASGDWQEADAEIERLIGEAEREAPDLVGTGYLRRGMLRLRQGRWKEASDALDRAESTEAVWIGRAWLTYASGSPSCASGMLDRYLRNLPEEALPERAAALELQVRAQSALDRHATAAATLRELRKISEQLPTEEVRGCVVAAEGARALANGDFGTARNNFREAAELYEEAAAPFEALRARIDLGRSFLPSGMLEEALREARSALVAAERLGAGGEAERATRLIAEIDAAMRPSPSLSGLTRRETQVLELVARGCSNADIAGRLFISEHTIKRHVANILGKLDVPSRAAAAARYASRPSAAPGV